MTASAVVAAADLGASAGRVMAAQVSEAGELSVSPPAKVTVPVIVPPRALRFGDDAIGDDVLPPQRPRPQMQHVRGEIDRSAVSIGADVADPVSHAAPDRLAGSFSTVRLRAIGSNVK